MKKLDVSTKKHPRTFCLLDDDDYEWARYFKWSAEQARNTIYVVRRKIKGKNSRTLRLHREVMRARGHEEIDHKDGNGLNNIKKNLRLCSCIQNQQNRIKRGTGKCGSKYKGVFYRKRRSDGKKGRCFAYITIDKARFNLGTFDTDIEAAKEYDSKALYYFKEFARLNFPANETTPSPIKSKI